MTAAAKSRHTKPAQRDALLQTARGAIQGSTPDGAPTKAPASEPEHNLRLAHVAGFTIREARDTLHFVTPTKLVLPAAALGIVADISKTAVPRQAFTQAHADDVLCLAFHKASGLVATGEQGQKCAVRVWSAKDAAVGQAPIQFTHTLPLGKGYVGVAAVGISPCGTRVAAAAQDNEHTVFVWDLAKPEKPLAEVRGGSSEIVSLVFGASKDEFATVGQKTISFWTFEGAQLTAKKGSFGDVSLQDNLFSLEYLPGDNLYATGTAGGNVLLWSPTEHKVVKVIKQAHPTGGVFAASVLPDGQGLATGGKDGTLRVWSSGFDAKPEEIKLATGATVRALDALGQKLAVGLDDGSYGVYDRERKEFVQHGQAHSCAKDAEVWGLAVAPRDAAHFVTAGDDCRVYVWSALTGAADATCALPSRCRAIDVSPSGVVAAGTDVGEVAFFSGFPTALKLADRVKVSNKSLDVASFSPDGSMLAVAGDDSTVYVLKQLSAGGKWAVVGKNPAHTSSVLALDWATDNSLIQSNSNDYELLFTSVDPATGVAKHETSAAHAKQTRWATYTCEIGWATTGIWERGQDGSDINAVDRFLFDSAGGAAAETGPGLLAIGNDDGKVELMRYPCVAGESAGRTAPRRECSGHSAHVTNVRFSPDGKRLFSAGGRDGCVFMWEVVAA